MTSNNRNQTEEDPNTLSLEVWDARLQQMLYRLDCPSPDLLQEFYWQQIAKERAAQIRNHLQLCSHCRQELAAIQHFVEQDGKEQATGSSRFPILEQLTAGIEQFQAGTAEWWAHWVEGGQLLVARMFTTLAPAQHSMMALRAGEHEGRKLLTYEIDGGEISLIVQRDAAQRLLVNVQLLSEKLDKVEGHFHLSAKDPNRLPITGTIDEFGSFTIPDLWPERYQLLLAGEGYTILVPELDLRLGN